VTLSPSEEPVPSGQPPVVGIAFLGDSITAGLGLMADEAREFVRIAGASIHPPGEAIGGLSGEVRARLAEARPATLAAAGRLPGMTPAALAVLYRYARRAA